jgi:hypothetical protein
MPIEVTIDPGRHDRDHSPLSVDLPSGIPEGIYRFADRDARAHAGGTVAQAAGRKLWFVTGKLKAGQPAVLRASPGAPTGESLTMEEESDTLTFLADGALVTRYHFGDRSPLPLPARPYFSPVKLGDTEITRRVTPRKEPQPKIDHPHHRSLWVAHGLVNGVDLWSEDASHGLQKHTGFAWQVNKGPVWVGFEETLTWQSAKGVALVDESRVFRAWQSVPGGRFLDLEVTFRATHGDVTFGDTKEGGICAIRLREPLQGDQTGLIAHALGGLGEGESWGHRASWIDYSGELDGRKVGIAVLDHPKAFRYPTHWHIRDYGLFAANPFAWHDYQSGWSNDGSHVLKAGASLPFRYRIFLHEGDRNSARVAARWLDWAFPPKTEAKAT